MKTKHARKDILTGRRRELNETIERSEARLKKLEQRRDETEALIEKHRERVLESIDELGRVRTELEAIEKGEQS